ncbi:MAG: PD-(D/E)XK nuclease family protein [bacterium]|nr:PD-(D/E)XK nuclease family protein [bacterium]
MPKLKDSIIRLSPSTTNLFLECKKCFWLAQVQEIHRPRGIFPSLPSGMDNLIKKYFDNYRIQGTLPPEIEGKVDGVLMADLELLNKWRSWRTGLVYHDPAISAQLSGALDDLLVNPQKHVYMPFDYKTRGFALKDDSTSYYQNQLNCYGLMLEKNGMKAADHGYLCYYIPTNVGEHGVVTFEVTVKKMNIDPSAAQKVFEDAVALIKGPMPKAHSTCIYCIWGNEFVNDQY